MSTATKTPSIALSRNHAGLSRQTLVDFEIMEDAAIFRAHRLTGIAHYDLSL